MLGVDHEMAIFPEMPFFQRHDVDCCLLGLREEVCQISGTKSVNIIVKQASFSKKFVMISTKKFGLAATMRVLPHVIKNNKNG